MYAFTFVDQTSKLHDVSRKILYVIIFLTVTDVHKHIMWIIYIPHFITV